MTLQEDRFHQLTHRLRGAGYRITPQRAALLRLITQSTDHPSASRLYEQIKADFPTTSLATVYKTLTLLNELGEVLELGFAHDDNRYDGSKPYPHPHVICVRCRAIVDPDIVIGDLSQEAARQTGFVIIGHRVDLYGLCPTCKNNLPANLPSMMHAAGKESTG